MLSTDPLGQCAARQSQTLSSVAVLVCSMRFKPLGCTFTTTQSLRAPGGPCPAWHARNLTSCTIQCRLVVHHSFGADCPEALSGGLQRAA